MSSNVIRPANIDDLERLPERGVALFNPSKEVFCIQIFE